MIDINKIINNNIEALAKLTGRVIDNVNCCPVVGSPEGIRLETHDGIVIEIKAVDGILICNEVTYEK